MGIVNAIMVPHPPLIIPEVGRGEEDMISATVAAYESAARFVRDARPDTVVIISPHTAMYYDWFHISPDKGASGGFEKFGARSERYETRYDVPFVAALCERARAAGFPAGTDGERDASLDHATMIPLHFLQRAYGGEPLPCTVRVGFAGLPLIEHYRLGMLIAQTASALGRRVSVIASGDLSHKLKEDGPYGFAAEGPEYDKRVMDVMSRAAFGELLAFPDSFCESAAECGHRSFTIMAGCFDGREVASRQLSYEGPFGVGYGVCLFTPEAQSAERAFYDKYTQAQSEALARRRANEDEYVRLARLSVETFVKTGNAAALPEGLSGGLTGRRAGVFVSLHKGGQLRGCIGTTQPTTASVAREILQNGVSACSEDPRFPAVSESELAALEYSVDVLGDAETIASPAELNVKRYGVIVSSGRRRGLLLPDLEGVDTVEKQIEIARAKAGIDSRETVTLQRFEVVRHE